jgi:hypothetical protein
MFSSLHFSKQMRICIKDYKHHQFHMDLPTAPYASLPPASCHICNVVKLHRHCPALGHMRDGYMLIKHDFERPVNMGMCLMHQSSRYSGFSIWQVQMR